MDNGKLGKFLAELRKEKGLTQEKLAELIDCDNRTISKWETGVYTPPIQYLTKLSDLYNISIAEIMQCERNNTKENNNKLNNENIINVINDYNKTTKRKTLIFSIIIMFLIITTFLLSIVYIKANEWNVITIDDNDDNESYVIKGSIIYNNSKSIFNINEILYSTNTSGTKNELIINQIKVSLVVDNKTIISKESSFDSPVTIEEALDNTYFYETEDYGLTKNQEVKIIIEYVSTKNNEVVIININK